MMTKQQFNRLNSQIIAETRLVVRFGLICQLHKDKRVTVHFGFFKAPQNSIYLIKQGIFFFNSIAKDWDGKLMYYR